MTAIFAGDYDDVSELMEMNIDRVDAVTAPANGVPFLIIKALPDEQPVRDPAPAPDCITLQFSGGPVAWSEVQKQVDALTGAQAMEVALHFSAAVAQLTNSEVPMTREANEVAKAAVDQAALLKELDGKTPLERARIVARRTGITPPGEERVWKGTESLDGKTPVERAAILKAKAAAH